MAVSVTTQSNYIIDGDELSAGERAFLRDARVYVVDGAEAGTASIRQYIREHSLKLIEGRVETAGGPHLLSAASFAIDGRTGPDVVFLGEAAAYVIDGRSRAFGPVAARYTCSYIINLE